ncbi:MAG: hypothetical protein L3J43_03325 [Sulfurovum sp.]|nr:hypothetical protein [Sulfurovum sp.]
MKKMILTMGISLLVIQSPIVADRLKNSLTNLLNDKNSVGMVNLDNLSINGKPKPTTNFKRRSPNTIISTYKDYKIRKKEANAFLNRVTKGKVKDYDRLPKKQRKIVIKELVKIYTLKNKTSRPDTAIIATVNGVDVIKKEADDFLNKMTAGRVNDFDKLDEKQQKLLMNDLAKPIVLKLVVENNLTVEEKDAVLRQVWLDKEKAAIDVSSNEMLALYEEKKKKSLAANPNAVIPEYLTIGRQLKSEMIEKKISQKLMHNVKIEINFDDNSSTDSNSSIVLDNNMTI